MTSAMKALKVKFEECKFIGKVVSGGCRTPIKIDSLVPVSRICQELEAFVQRGFVERVKPNSSVYLSPIFFLQKKQPNKIRCLNDYRKLNAMCDFSQSIFMDVQRTIQQIPSQWTTYSMLDISNAFYSIPLEEPVSNLFGFNLFNETYRWKCLPMGWGLSSVLFCLWKG